MSETPAPYLGPERWRPGLYVLLRHLRPRELATLAAIRDLHGAPGAQELRERLATQMGEDAALALINEAREFLYYPEPEDDE